MTMKSCDLLFLSQEDLIKAGVLDMSLVVPLMEDVYTTHHKKDFVLPDKCVLRWGDADSEWTIGRINAMPGYIGGNINAVGIKWIASNPNNPFKSNLPRASAIVILNDPETLVPIAIMDGTALSASRTGANTGVAAKYLSKQSSKSIGLIGAGVQNRTQLPAVLFARPDIDDIRVFDIDQQRAEDFAKEMGVIVGREIKVVSSARVAAEGTDIFITATATKHPIVDSQWLEPGIFYSHVGSHECEFDTLMKIDKRFVDDWNQIKHRGVESLAIMHKSGMIDDSYITGEIGMVTSGSILGRENDHETIYFNSVGLGIQDVALGMAMYNKAKEIGLGQTLRLWDKPFAI